MNILELNVSSEVGRFKKNNKKEVKKLDQRVGWQKQT